MSKYGSEPTIHESTRETRERAYERLRDTKIPMKDGSVRSVSHEVASKVAEHAAREAHSKLNRG